MDQRRLGNTDLIVTRLGFGAFKIGRNKGIKYPRKYDLPDDDAACSLLNGMLDLGINLIDTAPAYGTSEQRIGMCIADRRDQFILSTKVGETFDDAAGSTYDFTPEAVETSVMRSLERLHTHVLDVVFIHSAAPGSYDAATVHTLLALKGKGIIRAVGMSGKTPDEASRALEWADAIMVEYHAENTSHADVMAAAHDAGVGVVVKKGLASGHHDAAEAVRFCLGNPHVDTLIVGTSSLEHMRANIAVADTIP